MLLVALDARSHEPDGQVLMDQSRDPIEVTRADPDVDAHRLELLDGGQIGIGTASGGIRPHEVADLDFRLADAAVDGGVHAAVTQVQLGVSYRGLGGLELGRGGGDPDAVVGLRLRQAGEIGLDLGFVFLAIRLGLVHLLARGGVTPQQRPATPLLKLCQPQELLPVEAYLGRLDFAILGLLGLLECGLGLGLFCLRGPQRDLVRLLVDDEQELSLPDQRALLEVPLDQEAADTRPDRDVLQSMRVVAFGVTSTGTLIRRDEMTPTVGGGASAETGDFWQPTTTRLARIAAKPAIARLAKAVPMLVISYHAICVDIRQGS